MDLAGSVWWRSGPPFWRECWLVMLFCQIRNKAPSPRQETQEWFPETPCVSHSRPVPFIKINQLQTFDVASENEYEKREKQGVPDEEKDKNKYCKNTPIILKVSQSCKQWIILMKPRRGSHQGPTNPLCCWMSSQEPEGVSAEHAHSLPLLRPRNPTAVRRQQRCRE